ncbi:MAG: crosslink repair DNA glycosylase YcaQ family protein [Chitinophagales bacterium]
MAKKDFLCGVIGAKEYLYSQPIATIKRKLQTTFLMADYDEYGMRYKDRSALGSEGYQLSGVKGENLVYNRMMVSEGKIVGTWHRTIKNSGVEIITLPFSPLQGSAQRAMAEAIKRYCWFLGKNAEMN